jgi:hypothetical protein
MAEIINTETGLTEYWLDDKQFNCACCLKWFNEGKDNCKKCGFDLNKWNEIDEEEEQPKIICQYCKRNEKECDEQTENEKNPITEWYGWGLSCDDCYYENHPESDYEKE